MTQVDMRAFLDDVMAQRIADAVDALDHANKPRRDRPDVRVAAPAGWVRRVIQELTRSSLCTLSSDLKERAGRRKTSTRLSSPRSETLSEEGAPATVRRNPNCRQETKKKRRRW